MMASSVSCLSDHLWPPQNGCHGQFDFTLLFEQSVLSLIPSAALSLAAAVRIFSLSSTARQVNGRAFQVTKLYALILYAAVQLALLVIWSSHPQQSTRVSVPAAAISLINSIICCWLSYIEHGKSLRPSSVLGIYFFFSCLFDAVQVRTLWLNHYPKEICGTFTASFSIKAVILILEAREKKRFLPGNNDYSPEETSGVFTRSIFLWLDKLLLRGFRKQLSIEDLYPLDRALDSYHLHTRFEEAWSKTHSDQHKYSLLRTILTCFAWEFIASIIPRLLLIGFTFCQPLLLNRTLAFLQDNNQPTDTGNGFITAYVVVYLGLALSTGLYWHRQYRCLTMIRGSLVTIIYKKTLELNNSDAAVTLMSTDIEQIIMGLRYVHEMWANVFMVGIGIWLLERELGVAAVVPAIIAVLCSLATIWNAVRARINSIPQDSFFLPGPIRLNLDPNESVSIDEMVRALQDVQLWTVIEALGGVEAEMKPELLSHGQKQLFCIARALLHPDNKMLLLDEATSSLDSDTDAIVQKVIRHRFSNHTVIAVVHRVETIVDFDRVAVFSEGGLVEFDDPTVLLENETSLFKKLCDARGCVREST